MFSGVNSNKAAKSQHQWIMAVPRGRWEKMFPAFVKGVPDTIEIAGAKTSLHGTAVRIRRPEWAEPDKDYWCLRLDEGYNRAVVMAYFNDAAQVIVDKGMSRADWWYSPHMSAGLVDDIIKGTADVGI